MKPVELRDLLAYRFLSDVQYAPNGQRAALIVSKCSVEKDSYTAELWLYENDGLRKLAALEKHSHFLWLDDRRILFSRPLTQDNSTDYMLLNVDCGKIEPFLSLPFPVGKLLMLDPSHFAAIGSVDAGDPCNGRNCTILDEVPFWADGCGFTNKKRRALFLIDADPMHIHRITAPLEDVNTITLLGDTLYYNVRTWEHREQYHGFHIRAIDWRTGENRLVAEDAELSAEQLVGVNGELWLIGTDKKRYGRNENPWFFRVQPDGKLEIIRRDERSSQANIGTDCRYGEGCARTALGDALYTLSTRGGNCHLYRIRPDGTSEAIIDHPGSIDCFALSEHSEEILLIALYDTHPQELYSYHLQTGTLRRISHFNDAALEDKYIAQPQRLAIQSQGCDIEGWVLLPNDYDPGKRYPAVLDIHGGPKTAYGPVFVHSMQLWAGMGYFVFYCNPRGSDGGDNEFMDIRGRYGEIDYQNVMDFTDAVLAAWPQIDPARVCVTGGSYGGFMTNWIVGHTDRFCCAVSQRSISNWISCYGLSDIGLTFVREETAGTPWTNPEIMWRQSPLRYAANVHTPTLFLHSDEDYRCPMEQGLQMYTALMDQGIPTRLCLFHGESHELSRAGRPKNRLRRLEEIRRWFEIYAREAP